MASGAWGSGGWGSGAWGGATAGTLSFVVAAAWRENVVRLEFSVPVYFSTILDAPDASIPSKYAVTPVDGVIGANGEAPRPLLVVATALPGPADGVERSDRGRFVDLVLDRPMTPFPAAYDVAISQIFSTDLSQAIVSDSRRLLATFRQIDSLLVQSPVPSRDIANSQTLLGAQGSLPNPNNPLNLGTIVADDTGDYAFDSGIENLKKRIIRRLVTVPGGFAHMPDYGVGIPLYGKRLALPSVLNELSAKAEAQIGLEPDVAKVRVRPLVDPNMPGIVRFQVLVRTKTSQSSTVRFDVPFSIAA